MLLTAGQQHGEIRLQQCVFPVNTLTFHYLQPNCAFRHFFSFGQNAAIFGSVQSANTIFGHDH
ncbi:hypothetical protein BGI03_10325 [Snodgrassella alvi]|nr:hypothetical protein BGI01_09195 [Snodgrassella alvi]ORF16785.1 hypothetical protein BGI03_10325 [Snodgrassella alvi]